MSKALPTNITTDEVMKLDYHYSYPEDELRKDYQRLKETTVYKSGAKFRPGIKLCHHYFPNFFSIQNKAGLSFDDAWNDYQTMDKVVQWGKQSMSKLWLSWIRRAVYMSTGLPNSSFYRPHFAKMVIDHHQSKSGVLFDPCAGWGGRLLGTTASGWQYVACEPNKETFTNLQRLVEFLGLQDQVELHNIPAEDYHYKDKVDVVLTSPPYFDLEIYCQDDDQSYNKYNNYDQWNNQWLKPLIANCQSMLTTDGLSCWNVMNYQEMYTVQSVTDEHPTPDYEFVESIGFRSPLANLRKVKNKDVTYVWKRK